MSFTLDHPQGRDIGSDSPSSSLAHDWPAARILAIGGLASVAAGAIHVAAIAAHSEHRAAVWAFVGIALAQLIWGTLAFARPHRWLAASGIALGVASIGGWVVAKTTGIGFIDGLDVKEAVRFSDGLAAGLAVVTVLCCVAAIAARKTTLPRTVTAVIGVAILGVTGPGTLAAVDHAHAGGGHSETAGHSAGGEHTGGGDHSETTGHSSEDDAHSSSSSSKADGHKESDGESHGPAAVVPPKKFDPKMPIDLSGVKGVSPTQQARAENLLAVTLKYLPQWADPAYAETKGFRSIGDGGTGEEHYVNPEFMASDTVLDPNEPESLVYDTTVSPKKLVAAMFMLTPGSGLKNAPDIGGPLTQWHIHNNLCFTAAGKVGGLTDGEGKCSPPLFKGPETPMIHVWIEPHPCGPFAALDGIAGGQIAEGETKACNAAHGSHG